jgi:hypothetical protein
MENVALRRLNVGYNKIYDEGAWELMEALSENSTLRGLDVQRNEISDEGGRHVGSLLRANATLTEVDMRSNQLSPELVTRFEKTHGERVNARWQQEPPKKEKNIQAYSPGPMEAVGGRVAAKRAERAAKKEARRAAANAANAANGATADAATTAR